MTPDELRRIFDPQARAAAHTAWKREQAEAARQADAPAPAGYVTGVDTCHETGHTTTVTVRQDPDGTCTVVSSETTKVTAVGLVVPESDADATLRQWVGKGLTFWVISSAPKQAWVERAIGLGDLDSFTAHGEAFWANGARMLVVDPHDGDRIRGMDISRLFIESIPSSSMGNNLRMLLRHGAMHHGSPSVVAMDPWVLRELGIQEAARRESPFEGLHNEPAPPLKPLRPMTSDELSKIVGELPTYDAGYMAEIYGVPFLAPKSAVRAYREAGEIEQLQMAIGPEAVARAKEEAQTTTKTIVECLREEIARCGDSYRGLNGGAAVLDELYYWKGAPMRAARPLRGGDGSFWFDIDTQKVDLVSSPSPGPDGELVPMSPGYAPSRAPAGSIARFVRPVVHTPVNNFEITGSPEMIRREIEHMLDFVRGGPAMGSGVLTGPPTSPSTRIEVVGEQRPPCPDCKGTGLYQGLFIVEPCQACGGGGRCG